MKQRIRSLLRELHLRQPQSRTQCSPDGREYVIRALPNGVIINDAYCDRSMTRDYDREALNAFFATLKEEDFEVVVVRSLNDITDDIYDLEEFVKTITDMGIWLYSLEVGPVPIIVSHAEDFGC